MIEIAHMDDPKLETSNDYNLPGRLFAVFVVTLCSFGIGLFLTWVSSLNPIWGGPMTDWPSVIFTGLATLTGACFGVKQFLLKPVLMETGVDWKFLVASAAHEGTHFLESGDILRGTLSFTSPKKMRGIRLVASVRGEPLTEKVIEGLLEKKETILVFGNGVGSRISWTEPGSDRQEPIQRSLLVTFLNGDRFSRKILTGCEIGQFEILVAGKGTFRLEDVRVLLEK
jgi:hypothetical protein